MAQNDTDAISMLLEDHQEARRLLTQVAAGRGAEKEEAFHQLVYELARHETAEEEVVYPALRRSVPAGSEIADVRIKEEEQANRILADLEKLDVSSSEFDRRFEDLRKAVVAHADAEETHVFPRLRQAEDMDDLQSMGRLLAMAKSTAPTHPHPHVPGTAKANLMAGPVAAVIDRTRDAIRDARKKIGA